MQHLVNTSMYSQARTEIKTVQRSKELFWPARYSQQTQGVFPLPPPPPFFFHFKEKIKTLFKVCIKQCNKTSNTWSCGIQLSWLSVQGGECILHVSALLPTQQSCRALRGEDPPVTLNSAPVQRSLPFRVCKTGT